MMNQPQLGRYTTAFGLSFAITSVLSALLVVIKETHEETVLAWLRAATGHHWISHGMLDLILFLAIGWTLAKTGYGTRMSANALAAAVAGAAVVSSLIIAGFFLTA